METLLYTHTYPSNDYSKIRAGNNKPEVRAEVIRTYLRKQGYAEKVVDGVISDRTITDLGVCSPSYMSFLRNAYQSWQEWGCDPDYIFNQSSLNVPGIVPHHFSHMTDINLRLPPWKRMGHYATDAITPIYDFTYQSVKMSASCAFVASERMVMMLEGYEPIKNIYCSTVHPGHHASFEQYGGYCMINQAGLVALNLYKNGFRPFILDLDYHAGDGTTALFDTHHDIAVCSIHADPTFDYPSYSGFEDERGLHDNIKNICLSKGTDIDGYLNALDRAENFMTEFYDSAERTNLDVIVLSFGFDTYKDDPEVSKICGFNLDANDYILIGERLREFSFNIPFLIVQEGGYCIEKGGEIVDNLLKGLSY